MKRGSYIIFFVVLVLGLSLNLGCSTIRLTDFTVISTRNIELAKMDLDSLPQTKNVVGEDRKFMILWIPLGVPHIENAVDDALEKGNGDIMVDAVLFAKGWWFLIGENILEVKGSVVKTRHDKQ